jgi:hypothetical protein
MRSVKWIAFIGMLALATPAAADLRPSPLGEIYESYNDCFAVATKEGMKPEMLQSLGWTRATTSSKDGKVSADGPTIFGHATREPLILLSSESGEGLCIVAARLESAKSFAEFTKAWGGKLPPPNKEGVTSFKAKGHIVQLRQTGSPQEPSLSIAVMTPFESE